MYTNHLEQSLAHSMPSIFVKYSAKYKFQDLEIQLLAIKDIQQSLATSLTSSAHI